MHVYLLGLEIEFTGFLSWYFILILINDIYHKMRQNNEAQRKEFCCRNFFSTPLEHLRNNTDLYKVEM